MIAVDVNDVVELHTAGMSVLERELGTEAAAAFMSLSFCGRGDYTAEKAARLPRTPEQVAQMKAKIIEEARQRGQL
jgi:hypothetical protein